MNYLLSDIADMVVMIGSIALGMAALMLLAGAIIAWPWICLAAGVTVWLTAIVYKFVLVKK